MAYQAQAHYSGVFACQDFKNGHTCLCTILIYWMNMVLVLNDDLCTIAGGN